MRPNFACKLLKESHQHYCKPLRTKKVPARRLRFRSFVKNHSPVAARPILTYKRPTPFLNIDAQFPIVKLPLTFVVGLCVTSTATLALAGGGPENVLLVVNNKSEASKTIANSYVHWRQIPACNVVYVDWAGNLDITDANSFRDQILMPALVAMDKRNLAPKSITLLIPATFPGGSI